MSRPSLVMAVFNGLEFDGRVQRAASALASVASVHVLALSGEGEVWRPSDGAYSTEGVPGPMMGLAAQRRFQRRFQEVVRERRPRVVYAHDYYTAWSGYAAARSVGARFVYDAHELLKPVPGQRRSLRERVFERLERMGARHADLVVCANEPRARLFQQYHGLARLPLVVRNIPDESQEPALPTLERDLDSILYQGDMGLGRGLGTLLEALTLLGPEATLVMAGGGPALDKLRAMASAEGLGDRVRFLGRVPRAELPALMAQCGIGVLSYPAKDLNNVYCAPNKVFEYARAGLPMIAIGSDYLSETVQAPGLGRALPSEATPAAFSEAVREVAAGRERHVAACRAFASENTWTREATRLRDAVRDLLGGDHA